MIAIRSLNIANLHIAKSYSVGVVFGRIAEDLESLLVVVVGHVEFQLDVGVTDLQSRVWGLGFSGFRV
jgi:hypothetical protein